MMHARPQSKDKRGSIRRQGAAQPEWLHVDVLRVHLLMHAHGHPHRCRLRWACQLEEDLGDSQQNIHIHCRIRTSASLVRHATMLLCVKMMAGGWVHFNAFLMPVMAITAWRSKPRRFRPPPNDRRPHPPYPAAPRSSYDPYPSEGDARKQPTSMALSSMRQAKACSCPCTSQCTTQLHTTLGHARCSIRPTWSTWSGR